MQTLLIPPSTEMHIGEGLFSTALVDFCRRRKGKIVLVADETLKELYAKDLADSLSASLCTIPSGKKAKTWETAERLLEELCKLGIDRNTTLIALGGGSTTDLAGFVASIYLRGVPLVFVPTTLLAVVDASIGGKTAIDTSFGKNLVGSFYSPTAIFADLQTLQTLPAKERLNGFAEILKMGLIHDASLWQHNTEDPAFIIKAIQGKIGIVEHDPKDQGIRRILNFGHTIGHALEAIFHYEISHGEAVAIGCAAESHLSMQLGYLSEKEFDEIQKRFASFPLRLQANYSRTALLHALTYDKKRADGIIRFVLLDRIGHALPFEGNYCRPVSPEELGPTLDWLEKRYL